MKKKIIVIATAAMVMSSVSPVTAWGAEMETEQGEVVSNPWTDLFDETTKDEGGKGSSGKSAKTEGSIGTVKIVKKIAKKKNAKKIKITIKKLKDVNGYQVYVFKKKSFAKKNKKILYKKTITKNTNVLKVSNKKLSKKKTLFVKVRAFKKTNGKNVYGSWSKIAKVKVK